MTDSPHETSTQAENQANADEAAQASRAGVLTALVEMIAILVAACLIDPSEDYRLLGTILVLSGCGWFWLPIGAFSGWIAHKCLSGKGLPTTLVAAALATIGMLSLLGWGFVVTL